MFMENIQDDISDIELKQRWRLYWIHCIFEFANLNLQEMSWIQGNAADWPDGEIWSSSYEECISAYFDTLALDDAYQKALQWGNISQAEADKVKDFHQLASFYFEPSEDPKLILKDKEWLKVVAAAKDFWKYLKENVTSQREIQLINTLEKRFLF